MPLYTLYDSDKDEYFEEFLTIEEKESLLENFPHIKQPLCSPKIGDPWHVGTAKPSEDFNSLLKKIKKDHRGSNITTR